MINKKEDCMKTEPIGPWLYYLPCQTTLSKNIQEMKQDALTDPANAQYFEIREQTFQSEINILDDPKNANLSPKELAELISNDSQRFSAEVESLLSADHSLDAYGCSFGGGKWIPE